MTTEEMPEVIWARPDTYEGVWSYKEKYYMQEAKYLHHAPVEAREKELLACIRELDSTLLYYEHQDGGHEAFCVRSDNATIINQAREKAEGVKCETY